MADEQKPAASAAPKKKEDKKAKAQNIVIPPKKPKLSKAERRALQEKQRAAKAAAGGGGQKGGGGGGQKGGGGKKQGADTGSGGKKKAAGEEEKKKDLSQDAGGMGGGGDPYGGMNKTLSLFSHLPQYRDPRQHEDEFSGVTLGKSSSSASPSSNESDVHPEVLSLGLKYADGSIRGGNARCKAMLRTFQSILQNYTPPPSTKDYRHDLDHRIIKPAFQYWTSKCRPHSVSMGNAFTFLKLAVASLDRDMDIQEAKDVLSETIDIYIQERIVFADKVITKHAVTKIVDGDVILTHANSEVVEILLKSAAKEKKFRVILVDSRPLLEGRALLESLTAAGIECTYILLNALSYVMMREVTKVFLGAAALMSDGSVLSRVGTACVALMARSNNVPVLFCCETYKISSRVQLESITGNELGNPDDVVTTSCAMDKTSLNGEGDYGSDGGKEEKSSSALADWRTKPNLKLLNLLYDLTPSEFVSGIVTEMGILPPTSVAVLLREMNPQDNDSAFKSS